MNEFRVYLSRWFSIIPVALSVFLTSVIFIVDKNGMAENIFAFCFLAIFLLLMTYVLYKNLSFCLIVNDDSIQLYDIFRKQKTILINEITNVKEQYARGVTNYFVYSQGKKLFTYSDLFKNSIKFTTLLKSVQSIDFKVK